MFPLMFSGVKTHKSALHALLWTSDSPGNALICVSDHFPAEKMNPLPHDFKPDVLLSYSLFSNAVLKTYTSVL